MKKPFVGQQLFKLPVGNSASKHKEQKLIPVVVSKVGRKFFTVETQDRYRLKTEFRLEDWHENTDYCANCVIYESEQDRADEVEARTTCRTLYTLFEYGRNAKRFKLSKLREIAALAETLEAGR